MRLLILLCSLIATLAASANTAMPASIEANTSTRILDCIDAVSGTYQESQCDTSLVGPQPIPVCRSHTTANAMHSNGVARRLWQYSAGKVILVYNEEPHGWIEEESGRVIPLTYHGGHNWSIDCSNYRHSELSGQNHPANYTFFFNSHEGACCVTTGSGERRTYRIRICKRQEDSKHVTYTALIESVGLPTGNRLVYEWNDEGVCQVRV